MMRHIQSALIAVPLMIAAMLTATPPRLCAQTGAPVRVMLPDPAAWSVARLETDFKVRIIPRVKWAKLPCVPRASAGFYSMPRGPIVSIGIHHGGNPSSSLAYILEYHIKEKQWGDIAYHYIVDKAGIVYEGRDISRPSDTNYRFRTYGLKELSGVINILLLGNLDVETIHEDSVQLQSAKLLVAMLVSEFPLVNIAGIKGHRDFIVDSEPQKRLVSCPGTNFYAPVDLVAKIRDFARAVFPSRE